MDETKDLWQRRLLLSDWCKRADILTRLGEDVLVTMIEHGLVKRPSDLYALTPEALMADGFVGELVAFRIINTIQSTATVRLNEVIFRLNIPGVGRIYSDRLADRIKRLGDLLTITESDLAAAHLARPMARRLLTWLMDEGNREEVRALALHLNIRGH